MPRRKASTQPEPAPDKDPGWLLLDPTSKPPPPVNTRLDELPFLDLGWPDFERLGRRLAATGGHVEEAWHYGTQGQAQYGIDILVRLADGTYEVWQTKRYQKLTAADVTKAIKLFLSHPWAEKARTFVLTTACPMATTGVVDTIEAARTQLAAKNIALRPLDSTRLTLELKKFPDIIDDFFDRPWVEKICPQEAVRALENRFSPSDAATLRARLRDCYGSWATTVDPGLLIAGQDHRGQIQPAISISDRYVQPDLLVAPLHQQAPPPQAEQQAPLPNDPSQATPTSTKKVRSRLEDPALNAVRTPLDSFLAAEARAVISAQAGAGKSALLRFLALDILSDSPVLESVRTRYRQHIPIWIPFALWARMANDAKSAPSLPQVVASFLRALGEDAIVPDVLRALESSRVIYLVDGLDEAPDPRTAETLAALLSSYVNNRNAPAIVTSRPQGMQTIDRLGAVWKRVVLAPLSDAQQRALAGIWYRILHAREAETKTPASQIANRAKRSTEQFFRALHKAPDILRLAQTPLFLLAFMELARHGHLLPRSRFEACREIIAQLVEHQPHKRETGALAVGSASLDAKLRDRLLADLAFALHSGELKGAVNDAATDEDALARAIALIRHRESTADLEKAETRARAILRFSEERAGLLVKRAPSNIGFLHLSLQEHLAARHLQQRSLDDRIAFVREHASRPRWREPILNLLYLTDGENDVGRLLDAIAQATAPDAPATRTRDDLLAEAVFSDFAHDLPVVRSLAERHFAEIEISASGRRMDALLSHVVDGLSSESLAAMCRAKLAEWTPNRHDFARAGVIAAMPNWNQELRPACVDTLLRNLKCGNDHVSRPAAETLSLLMQDPVATKARLLALLNTASDTPTISACLYAFASGWHHDEDVGAIALSARRASDPAVVYDAIRIRARRGETDDEDFQLFCTHAYREHPYKDKQFIPDLVQHFAATRKDAFTDFLRALARNPQTRTRDMKAIVGSLLYCAPHDPLLASAIKEKLSHEYDWQDFFGQQRLPTDRIVWTPELKALVERHIADSSEKMREYEFYWLSKSIKLPSLKAYFIRNLTGDRYASFWSAAALVEGWGPDDAEVQATFRSLLDAPPERLAMAARPLPDVIHDKPTCRAALLRALSPPHERVDLVLEGIHRLGVAPDDEEMFRAAWNFQTARTAPLYRDLWRAGMIRTFPWRPEVRELALSEINRRDGEVAAIATAYANDADVCRKLLHSILALPDAARLSLLPPLQEAATSNTVAESLLAEVRFDDERVQGAIATIAHAEVLVAREAVTADDVAFWERELDAVGPDFEQRRMAGLVALAATGEISRFVAKRDHKGNPDTLRLSMASHKGATLYLNKLLPMWDMLIGAFGTQEELLQRLAMSGETILPLLDPSLPNAERLFAALYKPPVMHLRQDAEIQLLARFRPRSKELRTLITRLLLPTEAERGFGSRTKFEYWGTLVAAETYAQQFFDDPDLRSQLIARASAGDKWSPIYAALAELVLAHPDPAITELLREQSNGLQMDYATYFKLASAIASPERLMETFCQEALDHPDPDQIAHHAKRWASVLLRRLEQDQAARQNFAAALRNTSNPTHLCSLFSLLGRVSGSDIPLREIAQQKLEEFTDTLAPAVGLDILSGSHIPLPPMLREIAAS